MPALQKVLHMGKPRGKGVSRALLSVEACESARFLCVYAGTKTTLAGHQRLWQELVCIGLR